MLCIMKTLSAERVSVAKGEYLRLKKVDRKFGKFFSYLGHLFDIKKARVEARAGRIISQETLFRRLGL